MTYVYLNYENMKSVIKSINNYATSAENGKTKVRTLNNNHGTRMDLSGLSSWDEKVRALRDKTIEIDNRVETAKKQSESGITPKNGQDIAYYVPDSLEDTAQNVSYADAGFEYAKDLQEALKNGKDRYGRDVDTIVTDLATFPNLPAFEAFSAAFIEKVGIENLPQLALDVDDKAGGYFYSAEYAATLYEESKSHAGRRIADMFGRMMASASKTWNDEKATQNAEKLASSLVNDRGYGSAERVSALNYMFGASNFVDVDGDSSTKDRGIGLEYGNPKFLVEMANRLEQFSYKLPQDTQNNPTLGDHEYRHPLTGLVHAISANPQAAREWLSPELDANASEEEHREADKKTADRVRKMMGLNPVGDNQWTDDWMVLADRSSTRANSNNANAGPGAAATVSAVFNAIGESDNYIDLSDTSRVLTARTLSRYPIGLEESAALGSDDVYTKGAGEAGWASKRSRQPILSDLALSNLTGQVGQNDNASKLLSTSQANFNQERISMEVENAKRTGDYSGLANAYKLQSNANGFVVGAIARTSENEKANADARTKVWIDAGANVVNAVPVASELNAVGKTAASAARAQATSTGKQSLMEILAAEEAKEKNATQEKYTQGKVANRVSVTESLLKSGAYTKEQLKNVGSKPGTDVSSVIGKDGSVNIGPGDWTSSQRSDMKVVGPLLFNAQKNVNSGQTDLAIPALQGLDKDVDGAYEEGYRAAKPLKDSDKNEVQPQANKH